MSTLDLQAGFGADVLVVVPALSEGDVMRLRGTLSRGRRRFDSYELRPISLVSQQDMDRIV